METSILKSTYKEVLQIKSNIKRGDIYYINSANTQPCGSEQGSNRPAVVVSNDKCNAFSPVLEVVYLTSKFKRRHLPTHVRIMALYESTALCEQVHSVAKERLGNYVGRISAAEQEQVDKALRVSIGLEDRGGKQVNELKIFENEEFGEIRTVTIGGEAWFIGKDITDNLGYQNGSRDIDRHVDAEDLSTTSINDGTQNRIMKIVNESGIYALIFGSKLESAKRFKHWVTSEVLPAIKKTGSYQQPKSAIEMLELQFQAIKEVDTKVDDVNKDLQTFKQDLPLLGIEESKITCAVKRRGVNSLGGKESVAYQDKSLRGKVYSDIYGQLKREFGVASYKAIKRNQCELAISIIDKYQLPAVLQVQIEGCNSQKLLALG